MMTFRFSKKKSEYLSPLGLHSQMAGRLHGPPATSLYLCLSGFQDSGERRVWRDGRWAQGFPFGWWAWSRIRSWWWLHSRDHHVTSLAACVPQQALAVSVLSYTKTSELMGCGNLAPKSPSLVNQRPQVHHWMGQLGVPIINPSTKRN